MSSVSSALGAMQSTIKNSIVQRIKIETAKKKACRGTVKGGCVMVGNRSYRAVPVVDMYYGDGDEVWCIIDDTGAQAVIVGV